MPQRGRAADCGRVRVCLIWTVSQEQRRQPHIIRLATITRATPSPADPDAHSSLLHVYSISLGILVKFFIFVDSKKRASLLKTASLGASRFTSILIVRFCVLISFVVSRPSLSGQTRLDRTTSNSIKCGALGPPALVT